MLSPLLAAEVLPLSRRTTVIKVVQRSSLAQKVSVSPNLKGVKNQELVYTICIVPKSQFQAAGCFGDESLSLQKVPGARNRSSISKTVSVHRIYIGTS